MNIHTSRDVFQMTASPPWIQPRVAKRLRQFVPAHSDAIMTHAPVHATPREGALLAERYRLVEQLGEGGFATVFLARDETIKREVAIKCLDVASLGLGSEEQATVLERFEREAQLAANIQHPNVVHIFDVGHIDDDPTRPFIVMERLRGEDLGEVITRRGALAAPRLLPLFIQCADALGRSHDVGVVHKDLKPSNLFLCDIGTRAEALKLVDFGVAHLRAPLDPEGEARRLTKTGQMLGTPQYLPPEYINTMEVTPAFDVYQMGLILIEALRGEFLFEDKNSLQCIIMHSNGDLDLPPEVFEGPLGAVLERALAYDPAERYADGHALAEALDALDPGAIAQWGTIHDATAVPAAVDAHAPTAAVTSPSEQPSAHAPRRTRREDPADATAQELARTEQTAPSPTARNGVLLAALAALLLLVVGAGSIVGVLLYTQHQEEDATTAATTVETKPPAADNNAPDDDAEKAQAPVPEETTPDPEPSGEEKKAAAPSRRSADRDKLKRRPTRQPEEAAKEPRRRPRPTPPVSPVGFPKEVHDDLKRTNEEMKRTRRQLRELQRQFGSPR